MQPVKQITSRTVYLPVNDVDTDQIIPARYLTTTSREGLGCHLFADWRFLPDGSVNPQFELNKPTAVECHVLVAGRNFGCGSSREHAAWALLDYGFRAVISTEIADIFKSNALKNGLLPIVVSESMLTWLAANDGADVRIDVATSTIHLPDGREEQFPIDAFARHCLLEGVDQLGYLRKHESEIQRFEETRPWTP